jgi:TRAP-type C4-dicarboxylate transport system substrate-binding protein
MKRMTILLIIFSFCLAMGIGNSVAQTAKQQTIELKLTHQDPTTSFVHREGFVKWAKLISDKTKGRVKVTIFPGESLAKARDAYDVVMEGGVADISWGAIGLFPGRFPLSEVIALPMLGVESAIVGSKIIQELYNTTPAIQKEYPKVKHLIAFSTTDFPIGFRSKNVQKIEDMKGLRIRSTTKPFMAYLKALGAEPIVLPPPEMYESLQRGVLDGCSIDWQGFYAYKLPEVVKYILDAKICVVPFFIIMNEKTWNSLPPDIQKVFEEVSGMFGAELFGKSFQAAKDPAIELAKKRKVEITKLSKEEQARWLKTAEPVWEEWIKTNEAKGLPAREVFQKTRQLVKKYSQGQ